MIWINIEGRRKLSMYLVNERTEKSFQFVNVNVCFPFIKLDIQAFTMIQFTHAQKLILMLKMQQTKQ